MTAARRAPGPTLSDAQRLAWLRLIRSESIGPRTFRTLVNRFGGASGALDALPELGRQAGRTLRLCTPAEAEREFEALRRRGVSAIEKLTTACPLGVKRRAPSPSRPRLPVIVKWLLMRGSRMARSRE